MEGFMKKIIFTILLTMITGLSFAQTYAAREYNVDYWVTNLKAGISYPMDDLATRVNPGYNIGFSARKGLDMEFSVGGGVSYVSLPYKLPSAPGPFASTVLDIEAGWAPYMPDLVVWPYLKVGMGLFMMTYAKQQTPSTTIMADETTLGIIFGGGLNYPIGKMFAANIEVLYNYVTLAGGSGDANPFLTIDLGLTAYLK
jgi:hypothetical protein